MYVKLTNEADLPLVNEAREFPCGNKHICVANVNGTVSAMDNECLHRGGPLGQGMVDGGMVICPWHGWAWDPQTGQAKHNPAAKVPVYPVKVENGEVMVDLGG